MAEPVRPDEGEAALAVMSIGEHLEELRARLIKCLLALGAAFLLCWLFRTPLMMVLVRPHVAAMRAFELDTALKFASYLEPVVAQLKACVIVALILTSPFVIYQIWAFVAPGLFPQERQKAVKLGLGCMVFFAAGVAFGYFVFVPLALRYLVRLSGPFATPVLMIGSYLSTFFLLTFALGVAFQTPVIVFCLIRWGVITVEGLRQRRRAVILAAFVLGAVLTPPDPLTQIMMAVTLIVLYDLGGVLAAPSWATLRSFLQFTGLVALAVGTFSAWFLLWPVAAVQAQAGQVSVAGRALDPGEAARMRRGAACRTGPDGVARIRLGGKNAPTIFLAPAGRLRVHERGKASLLSGRALVIVPAGAAALELAAGPGKATVSRGRAEVDVPDADTLSVAVIEGLAVAELGGQTRRLTAGHTATLRRGGERADLTELERRWQKLVGPTQP